MADLVVALTDRSFNIMADCNVALGDWLFMSYYYDAYITFYVVLHKVPSCPHIICPKAI